MKSFVRGFSAWSYSRLSDWEACALRAKLKHIDKRPDPGSPAMARGGEVHEHVAKFLTGRSRALAPEFAQHVSRLRELRKSKPAVEQQWGFDAAWGRSEWFAPTTVCRIVVDAAATSAAKSGRTVLTIVDFKTGKKRDGYADQLELYAVGGLSRYPEAESVVTELIYLDQDPAESERRTFARTDLAVLRARWARRVRPMLADRKFAPNPGTACRWCPYSAARGGPCQF
jgi:hypothetical protein